jgi:hypothetical protein
MRKPRPIARLDEITITRGTEEAHIKYKDPAYGETCLRIGSKMANMTDQEILDLYNDCLKSQSELALNNPYVAIEVPLGSPQIEYSSQCEQWSPKGNVVRCLIDTAAEEEQEPVITVDGKELSWREFGRLICTYAGWGMRIEFTPEDAIHRRPKLEVKEP